MTAPIQTYDSELIAYLCKALAHPVRVQIVELLKENQEMVCGEIVAQLPLAQSTVSQHLKVLKDAGLVRKVIEGPRTSYSLNYRALERFKRLIALV